LQTAAVKILADLRTAGIAVDRDYRGGKFPAQVKQADLVGAKYTLILGENELVKGEIQLRNQATKEQRAIAIESLVRELKAL
jgi:histidyl-tRNA synthetase